MTQEDTTIAEGRGQLWRAVRAVVQAQRAAPPLQPVPRDGEVPLSFAQERMWRLNQLEPDGSAYNRYLAYHLAGALNVAALEGSLGEIVRRHESARSTFASVDGYTIRAAVQAPAFALNVVDLRSLPEEERKAESQRLLAEEARRPFNLAQDLLLRASLLQLADDESVLLLATHQMAFDDPSRFILIRELTELYAAFSAGQPSPLPELPLQYADFAHWERLWLKDERLETELAYWQDRLAAPVSPMQLPLNRARRPGHSSDGASRTFTLSRELSDALRGLSHQESVTLFVTLLAALQTLLQRYTSQDDLLIFTSTARRNRSELKAMIGLFANLLPLRVNFSGNPRFREILPQVRDVVLGAFSHQDPPIEQLMDMLRLEQDANHTSPFQVMFVFQNEPAPSLALPGLMLTSLDAGVESARFDLRLVMVDSEQGLSGLLKYKADLFDAATIRGLIQDYQTVLENIVADPDRRLADLLPLAETEQRRTSVGANSHHAADSRVNGQTLATAGQVLPAPRKTFVAPRDPAEHKLTKIWENVLSIQPIGVEDDFFDLGGHSLLAIRLFDRIAETFDRRLPLSTILQAPTVEQLAKVIHQEKVKPWSSLVAVQPGGARLPFFCVPPAGSTILRYTDLARALGPDQPLYGLQPLGMDGEQAPHDRIEEMAAHYINEIRTVQPEGPYLLGGACFGGIVAFEMAQQLHAANQQVALLALFDTSVPQRLPSSINQPPAGRVRGLLPIRYYVKNKRLKRTARKLVVYLWERVKSGVPRIAELSERFALHLKADQWPIRRFGGAQHQRIQVVWAAHQMARRNYMARIYAGRIHYFQSSERSNLEDRGQRYWQQGWSELAAGGLDYQQIPGSHGTMMHREPYVGLLAEKLRRCIDEAHARANEPTAPEETLALS